MDRSAEAFLQAHPRLRDASRRSPAFGQIRERAALDIDGERLYVVRGDTLGSESELLVEALIRGAQSEDRDDASRRLFLELDEASREAVLQRIREA